LGKARVGMSIYSYGADIRRRRMTVEQAIEHAAGLEVEGIELVDKQHLPNYMHPRVYDLQRLRDHIESFGMTMSCHSTYIDTRPRPDRLATVEELIHEAHSQIAEAAVLGAKVYRPAIFGAWSRSPEESEPYYQMVTRIIKEVLPDLKRHNIKWGSEIHAPMSPDFLLPIIRRVNDKSVGLVPDFSVWSIRQVQQTHVVGKFAPETLKHVLPCAVHIHAKAHSFNEKGEEMNTPYDKLIPIIRESGFDGYISAEFEGWWDGTDFDSRNIAETHVKLIRRYL